MKSGSFIPATFAVLLFISSCKKDNTESPSSRVLPKSTTEDVSGPGIGHMVETANLTYDAQNRILGVLSVTSPGNNIVYQYNADNSFSIDIYTANQLSIHTINWVNANGLIDSSFQYNDTHDTSTAKYNYNSANQWVQEKEYDYSTASGSTLTSTHDYTIDENGNVVQEIGDGQISTMEYYPDLLNQFVIGENAYFWKTKNLVKTITIQSGGDTQIITHTYGFDSSNRLTADTVVDSNGATNLITYSY